MAEFGHAKDDSGVPQVNISYAVNHDDATPLFYEMYPGSIIDNTQCTYMVDRAKEYGYKNVYIRWYGLTKKQRKILSQFGVTESYLNKVANKMNILV